MSVEITSPFAVLWGSAIAVGAIGTVVGAIRALASAYSVEDWGEAWFGSRFTLVGLTLIGLSGASWAVWSEAYSCTPA